MKKYLLIGLCLVSLSAFGQCPIQFEGWNTPQGDAVFNAEAQSIIDQVNEYCKKNKCTENTRRIQYAKAFSFYKKNGCSELTIDHLKTVTTMKLKGK